MTKTPGGPATIFICTKCGMARGADGKYQANPAARALRDELRAILRTQYPSLAASVRFTSCMGACDTPIGYAFCAPGREQLLFGRAGEKTPAVDIATAFAYYAGQRAGRRFVTKQAPASLHGEVIARLPVLKPRG